MSNIAAYHISRYDNFLEYYFCDIFSKLKEIDLFLKTNEGEIALSDVSLLLSLNTETIKSIMKKSNLAYLTKEAFVIIMQNGDSEICKLFRREIECGSPYVYTRENIAYIYNLDIDIVNAVCDDLNIKKITPYILPDVFVKICADFYTISKTLKYK